MFRRILGTDGLPAPTVPIRNMLVRRSSTIALVTGLLIGLMAGYFGGRWHLQRELRVVWQAERDMTNYRNKEIEKRSQQLRPVTP